MLSGCELLIERCLVFGDNGIVGDKLTTLFDDKLVLFALPLLLPDVFNKRELLKWDNGTDVDETEFLTVLTFVSDRDKSFLTASGECVPSLFKKFRDNFIMIINFN